MSVVPLAGQVLTLPTGPQPARGLQVGVRGKLKRFSFAKAQLLYRHRDGSLSTAAAKPYGHGESMPTVRLNSKVMCTETDEQ